MYASDAFVELLGRLGVRFVALNPGASIRGLHESFVHASAPELVLTLHEETAVAAAHGYAKASGELMCVLLHNLVGLQHASMAIFNAAIDQAPILLIGGSGPADAAHRRPWIDWIHSTRWQALAVRDFLKWDDEPRSIEAAQQSLVRAHHLALLPPYGPTYVAIDALMQEQESDTSVLDPSLFAQPATFTSHIDDLERAADVLADAERPVVLVDMTARSSQAFEGVRDLAESLAAPVIDLGGRHNLSTSHWADCSDDRRTVLADADVVLCLDVRDVTWALSDIDLQNHTSRALTRPETRVICMGLNELMHRGFLDLEGPVLAELNLVTDTAIAVPVLAYLMRERLPDAQRESRRKLVTARSRGIQSANRARLAKQWNEIPISRARLAAETWEAVREAEWLLANGSLGGWVRRTWQLEHFGDHLGGSGGAGLGYGVGASIGAALAHEGDDVLTVDLQADGDLLYTASALWTASRHRLPMLIVVDNNRTYGKDRLHQSVVAAGRGRGQDRVDVGIDIDDPAIDFAKLALAQGVEGFGPISDPAQLGEVLRRAVTLARSERRPVLIDVVTARP